MVKASVSRWKQLLGGLAVVLLLMPIPAYAAIEFDTLTWSLDQGDPNGILAGGPNAQGSTPSTGFLNILFAEQTNSPSATTIIFSNSFNGSGTFSADWTSLSDILTITAGKIKIEVYSNLGEDTTVIFTATFYFDNVDQMAKMTGVLSGSGSVDSGSYISVTIAVDPSSAYTVSSSATLVLTDTTPP
jgi:hypothetical protein